MDFEAFEAAARAAYEEIPQEFKEGVDGLLVSKEAVAHPTLPEVYTLGQCQTEEHVSDYGGPETTRSVVALYWGSFEALARLDPDFDWEGELWETLTHELRHHLESLAGDDALEDQDYAADELFKREEGLAFDPWYYQSGEELGAGVFRVEGTYYVEQLWQSDDFEEAERLRLRWRGRSYAIPRPEELGDIHFVWLEGVGEDGEIVELVLVRRRGWWEELKRIAWTYRPVVLESAAEAEPIEDSG